MGYFFPKGERYAIRPWGGIFIVNESFEDVVIGGPVDVGEGVVYGLENLVDLPLA